MTTYDVVKKLIGPIDPVGDSSRDGARYGNLQEMCILVDKLLFEIHTVSQESESQEHSVKRAADYAKEFINAVKEADY
jgi:hypothetical protein